MKLRYNVRPLQTPDGKWVAEYRDLESGSISGGLIRTAERVRLDGFFKTREEAIEYARKYLKEKGIEEKEIEAKNDH